jgi:hypothetical protein
MGWHVQGADDAGEKSLDAPCFFLDPLFIGCGITFCALRSVEHFPDRMGAGLVLGN